jgi:HNH endonuclease
MLRNLTQERLKEVIWYEPETGHLFYRKVPVWREKHFPATQRDRRPSEAGSYRTLKIDDGTYPSSWMVWLYHKGHLPAHDIDHINRLRWDDRIENLREATRSQQAMNRVRPAGILGYRGVKRNHKRFSAGATKEGIDHYWGSYDTAEEAAKVYDKNIINLFGEFAVLNFPTTPKRDWLYVSTW